tara:strand:+ start:11271 stop:11618 length:348 start_codon:yes stop_codon:yes gene_type:complete
MSFCSLPASANTPAEQECIEWVSQTQLEPSLLDDTALVNYLGSECHMFLQEFAYTLQPTEPEITKNNTQSRYATKSIVNLTSNIAIEKSSVKFIDINPPELVSLSISPLSVCVLT